MRSSLLTIAGFLSLAFPTIAGAQGADVYVREGAMGANNGTSWKDAFTDLQDALDAAFAGDEIWVAAGTYRPSIRKHPDEPRSATFQLRNDVALYGGFAGTETERDQRDPVLNATILSGDLAGDDGPAFENNEENAYTVVTGSGTDETAILDGFTITAGNANAPDGPRNFVPGDQRGAGMFIENGSPTIANCTIIRNWASAAAGIIVLSNSSPEFTHCTISCNSGSTGGGQGMWVDFEGAHATLTKCKISGNKHGVVVADFASATLVDCVIGNNDHDGVVVVFRASATLTNCTVANNDSGGKNRLGRWQNQGVTLVSNSSATLTNCVVWGNGKGSIYLEDSSAEVTYSCVEGPQVWPGIGNINEHPRFCWQTTEVFVNDQREFEAALDFGFLLSPDSPCIGTGEGGANMGANTGVCDTLEQVGRLIHLAPGTYEMDGLDLSQRVSLQGARGDGEGETVLDGTVFGLGTGAVLSNLTVTGGSTVGGIVVAAGESPEIRECTIAGNFASVGGGVRCDSGSSPTLINCLISGNSATFGGGVYCSEASLALVNCTITGNIARGGGGLRVRKESSAVLINCIVWDNAGGSIDLTDLPSQVSAVEVTYSLIQEDQLWPGVGNIDQDPLFVGNGDYRLRPASPAIDAGTLERNPAIDIDGNGRPCGAGIDMGAYEHCEPAPSFLFVRGDCNGDGKVAGQVSDAVFLLSHNFAGGPEPPCPVACDANGDGNIGSVTDAVYVLDFNFRGGFAPPPPFPDCGPRSLPGDDSLECENPSQVCQ